MNDPFWINNIHVLYCNNNYLKFVPTSTMSFNEKLNAITRFLIYFIILIVLFQSNSYWIIISISVICFIVLYFKTIQDNNLISTTNTIQDNNLISSTNTIEHMINTTKNEHTIGDTAIEHMNNDINETKNITIESGYYDLKNKLHVNKFYKPPKYVNQNQIIINNDDNPKFASCKSPTVNNPFMNPVITTFNDSENPTACNANDSEIIDKITDKFNKNLYRNVDEVFEIKNSQRQFYTVPPNQQIEFAKWCWKLPETCKEDQAFCLRNEDLRFKR